MKNYAILFLFTLISFGIYGQVSCPELLEGTRERLKKDIGYLASDKLKGREPGTTEIELAAQYILTEFKKLGLQPFAGGDLRQEFSIPVQVVFGSKNALTVKGENYKLLQDFYPVQHSSNGTAAGRIVQVNYGIVAPEKDYSDYKKLDAEKLEGKIFVMDVSSPDGIHPHSEYLKYHDLGERIKLAKEKGAAGVILVNLQETANDLSPNFKNIHSKDLPVIFVTNNKLAKSLKKNREVSFTTQMEPKMVNAYNLLGFLDNGARYTVVVGAHYDHLGMGGSSSLSADKEPQIHNGADDNASGVAGMLEIARNVASGREAYKKYNYLFIAFSGEEMGLLGSAHFTTKYDGLNKRVKYMLNLDMVGRLEDNLLAVNGIGTAREWEKIVTNIKCDDLQIKTSASGVGPSDHTNFYYQDIPVLHFFTGTHMDYHKPSDDVEKINLEGEEQVIRYILGLILYSREFEDMKFTPTSEASQMAPKFSVTLGVMPDYMFSGEGMKIDGVTEGRAADKAGLLAGDVVIKLGEVKVVDMMSYMKALGQFKKGDKAAIEFIRDGETMRSEVEF